MDALDHFNRLYGDLGLSPQDAAKWVFASGWNSALTELLDRMNQIPMAADTKASFAVYFQQMMHVDPDEIQRRMQ